MDAMDVDPPTQEPPNVEGNDPAEQSEAPPIAIKKEPSSSISTPKVSNNAPGFKYKYPEAAPTPPGEDDEKWNKIFTAADSRLYNKHHKNANESRKYRLSGETRVLALKILAERNEQAAKAAADAAAGIVAPNKKSAKPKAPPKTASIAKESSISSRDVTPGFTDRAPMSISEQIKSEGRARKAASAIPSSNHGSPGPTSAPKQSSPAPVQVKPEKPPTKKKGTAAPVKRPKTKAKPEGPTDAANSQRTSATPGPRTGPSSGGSDDDSNDGGEYCICRGPDDHRMMVYCEGGCEDWYHCSCIGINVEDAKELLDRFICPKCSSKTAFTTWKRMCRYYNVDGCRKAARVSDDPPSKYCSDEHKKAFWLFVKSKVRSDEKGSMGGALNEVEVGALLDSCKNAADFHSLGSKPKLPVPEGHDPSEPLGLQYLTPEEKQTIEEIQAKRLVIEEQIKGYQTRQKLLIMINKRAKTAQEHPNIDVKEICGYDNRLAMNEAEFTAWCNTSEGQTTLETGALGPRTAESKHIGAHIPYPGQPEPETKDLVEELDNICLRPRKKCKHLSWREIHAEAYSYSQKNLREDLERLDRKKTEIIDAAEVREATKGYYAENTVEQLF
ncbi:hypothetical protein CJF30_00009920 [Rutstroemia sp. NJR-2017a BBW]|nr:hypothetical protein CJF30_00009920 [Rutstroemia sp. NJR-2017a BBW]